MITQISGTRVYKIPGIQTLLPLNISWEKYRDDRTSFTLSCPYFNEYGQGASFEEALDDLSKSLTRLCLSLTDREKTLSADDKEILRRLRDELIDGR